jgi:hypothetical protein
MWTALDPFINRWATQDAHVRRSTDETFFKTTHVELSTSAAICLGNTRCARDDGVRLRA